jgi:death-on-curing protein
MIADFGGEAGVLSEESLGNCVAEPMMTAFQPETSQSVSCKAARLMYSILIRRPFVDGNKRTGWAAARVFLLLNGYGINLYLEKSDTTVRKVANGEKTLVELAGWFRLYSHPV